MSFDLETLPLYPVEPGVYLMKDATGRVLYVGKAKNLRSRLKQYFSSHDTRAMVPYLTSQVDTIEAIIVLTEKEALLLENQLIKRHKPKYNILLKDDKTFISLLITDHPWPMIRLVRNKRLSLKGASVDFWGSFEPDFSSKSGDNIDNGILPSDFEEKSGQNNPQNRRSLLSTTVSKGAVKEKGRLFGPYTSALAARQIHDLLSRLFPLRQCSDAELANRTRPCLLYDIKRCIAPCVGKCTKEEYQNHVHSATRLLGGHTKELLEDLKKQMEIASERLEYEKADALLKTIHQIEHVTQVQHIETSDDIHCDVIGLHREADAVLIALLIFREGRLISSEHFSFHLIASTDSEVIESFLLQHYTKNPPTQILVPSLLPNQTVLSELLNTSILTPQRGKKKDLLEMALRNARALFLREQDARSLKEKMLLDLQETLQLTRYPRRIECFDTSNLAGTDPVASLTCFINGERDPSRKRLFKIRNLSQPDDYGAMKQVLTRHLTRAKETQDFPDLLIVDGGKGHLNIVLEVFQELGIASVDAIAVTKQEARHDKGLTREKVYLPHLKDPLLIDPLSPLLFLLQRIRDAAHTQAISFHKKKRSARMISSELDALEGIGPSKKKKLLQKFGSVRALKTASDAQLAEIPGLSRRDRETLLQWMRHHAAEE